MSRPPSAADDKLYLLGNAPAMNRRKFIAGTAGMGAALALPRRARAQSFAARQYHSQPETSHLHIFLTRIWDAVREETGGRLDVTVHPGNNGVAMGDPDILKTLQAGDLEFFTLNGNILSAAHPVTDIQGIPFAFDTAAHATDLWDGALGDYMAHELAPTGIRLIPFGALENGVKQIISVEKPVHVVSDLDGYRMRVPNGDLFVDFYRTLGAEPLVINFNVFQQALRNGDIDGLENPLVVVEENRLFETCRHVAITNHQWAGFNMLASEMFWQSLPEDLRAAVTRNTRLFVSEQRAYVRAANDGYARSLRERGMAFTAPDLAPFRARLSAANFYRRWRERIGARAWEMMEDAVGPVG